MEQSKESKHLSRSDVQQKIESNIIGRISGKPSGGFRITINRDQNNELKLMGRGKIKVDFIGVDGDGKTVLGEIFVRQGKFLPAQRHKIASDVLKLITYSKLYREKEFRLFIIIGCGRDDGSADNSVFKDLDDSNSWLSEAIKVWNIKLIQEPLTDEEFNDLEAAVSNQKKGTRN